MTIVMIGLVGWLLLVAVAMSVARAAQRGDRMTQAARRYLADAEVIPLDRARRAQPCRAPIQCSRSCTISSSSR